VQKIFVIDFISYFDKTKKSQPLKVDFLFLIFCGLQIGL